jgi:hypothetical protein
MRVALPLQHGGTTSEEGIGASELGDAEAASSPKVIHISVTVLKPTIFYLIS